ncbi:hypothetical protein C7S16_0264 [Burkholderia thailandensis]|uniref:Uncharacterized protein n=1 Tax=Burkholderia thailandensis TaxID=57975 RepID=A0AAW9CZ87_BURTH|nr:hypothetical protein [Burkholderia thailandensis]
MLSLHAIARTPDVAANFDFSSPHAGPAHAAPACGTPSLDGGWHRDRCRNGIAIFRFTR